MASEKRFPASARKLKKARESGDVAKSRDLTAAIILSGGIFYIFLRCSRFVTVSAFLDKTLRDPADFSTNTMLVYVRDAWDVLVGVLGPFFICVALLAFAAEMLQSGFHFAFKPLGIKFSRLNFVTNLQRIFGRSSQNGEGLPLPGAAFEGFKLGIYLALIALFGLDVLYLVVPEILSGDFERADELLVFDYSVGARVCAGLCLILLFVGCLNLLYQRHLRAKRLGMGVEEFRREHRENEGDPELKGMRKLFHQEILLHGVIQAIRRSRVVVVSEEAVCLARD